MRYTYSVVWLGADVGNVLGEHSASSPLSLIAAPPRLTFELRVLQTEAKLHQHLIMAAHITARVLTRARPGGRRAERETERVCEGKERPAVDLVLGADTLLSGALLSTVAVTVNTD